MDLVLNTFYNHLSSTNCASKKKRIYEWVHEREKEDQKYVQVCG